MRIVDMHCDTVSALYRMQKEGRAEHLDSNSLSIDLKKMQAGEYCLQNFAIFVNLEQTEDPLSTALEMAALYERELEACQEGISPVYCWNDICKNRETGKISALLTIEEGGILKGSMDNLHKLYGKGVRMIGLSWNYPNEIGMPNLQKDSRGNPLLTLRSNEGLTEFGIQVVEETQRLGMLVDVSHLSDGGFWDVAQHVRGPFMASHSNAGAVCGVSRNLTDPMIRALAEKGGVMGINFCEDFLCMEERRSKGRLLEAIVRHICHIVNTGGEDCVGMGSDFDGIPGNRDMKTAADMQKLIRRLEQEGFSGRQIDKICGENVLRVYREVLRG